MTRTFLQKLPPPPLPQKGSDKKRPTEFEFTSHNIKNGRVAIAAVVVVRSFVRSFSVCIFFYRSLITP